MSYLKNVRTEQQNAESAIEALKVYEPNLAKVRRREFNGIENIKAVELVPGDVVEVSVGDKVPADIRICIIYSSSLRADQSILTGESVSVTKTTEAVHEENALNQDKINMLFSGTNITAGKCLGVVVSTGLKTEIGKIRNSMLEFEPERTPLQQKLDSFSNQLSHIVIYTCLTVFILNLSRLTYSNQDSGSFFSIVIYHFKTSIALAVAAVPEGLPAIITICLALGTKRMAKKSAIVKSLPLVETLGCTSVICSDKTGTLTANQMTVSKIFVFNDSSTNTAEIKNFDITGLGYSPRGQVIEVLNIMTKRRGYELNIPVAGWNYAGINLFGICFSLITTYDFKSRPSMLYYHSPLSNLILRFMNDKLVIPSRIGAFKKICQVCAMCNDSSITYNVMKSSYEKIGEATEAALCVLVEKMNVDNLNKSALNKKGAAMFCNQYIKSRHKKIATLEFSRDRRSMSVIVQETENQSDGSYQLFVKGAPESIIERCKNVMTNAHIVPMTDELKNNILQNLHNYHRNRNALRCLALAYKDQSVRPQLIDISDSSKFIEYETNLTLIGIVGMMDPPRTEVRNSIRKCHHAGIRVVVLTGDNKNTAEAICRMIGVFENNENVDGLSFEGKEFDEMSVQHQLIAARKACLFARVEPHHKSRIIDCLQKDGEIIAMTGDGVNDAPALKKADIGIAMGSGTAVAKSAAKMILANDDFTSIVHAVEEGRAIYTNMKQFIRYLISSNIGEIVCVFLTSILGIPDCVTPVQLLWVNLVTDSFPATAMGFNPKERDIMDQKPRRKSEPLISHWLFLRYILIGTYVGVATIGVTIWWFLWNKKGPQLSYYQLTHYSLCLTNHYEFYNVNCAIFDHPKPKTLSLSVLVLIEMFNAMNSLSENQSLLTVPPTSNPLLICAVTVSILLHISTTKLRFLQKIFQLVPLSTNEWIKVFQFSFPVILLDEVLKIVSRKFFRDANRNENFFDKLFDPY